MYCMDIATQRKWAFELLCELIHERNQDVGQKRGMYKNVPSLCKNYGIFYGMWSRTQVIVCNTA